MNGILLIFVVLMPFMSALAPTEWTPLPLIFIACVAPAVLFQKRTAKFGALMTLDAGFIAAFILGCIALYGSPIVLGDKNTNYCVALLITYILFFCIVRLLLLAPMVSWNHVSRAAHICLSILSIAIVVEFFLASFYGVYFSDLIHYAHKNLQAATMVTSDFKRPRAFAAEPGFTALAYECLWPLALIQQKEGGRHPAWNAVYCCGFLLLGSAAAIVCFSAAVILSWMIFRRNSRSFLKYILIVIIFVSVLAFIPAVENIFWSVVGSKIDLSAALEVGTDAAVAGQDGFSLLDRLNTYAMGLNLVQQFPMGIGWGTLAQAFASGQGLPGIDELRGSGLISLYLDIWVAGGVFGLIGFLSFVGQRIIYVAKSSYSVARYVMISVMAVAMHHALITELQYPFIWFSLAVADKLRFDKE